MGLGRRGLIGAFALVSLVGCNWGLNGLDRLDQLYPPVDAGSGGFQSTGSSCSGSADGGMADAGPLDLTDVTGSGYVGNFAVRLLQQGTILPVGPPAWDITIDDLFLAESDGQTMSMYFCGEQVTLSDMGTPTTLGATQVPCALQTVLGKQSAAVTFPLPNAGFSASNVVWPWGLQNVTDWTTYTLPTSADDPHVFDQDMDGNPGVTLDLLAPQNALYITRLAIWQFGSGTLSEDAAQTWLTGPLQFTAAEGELGGDPSPPPAISPTIPNATGSVYQMRRVGSSFTCAALVQYEDQIYQGVPSP